MTVRRSIHGRETGRRELLKALRPGKYRDALQIDIVSPIVKEKVAQTVHIIRAQLTRELADPLLERLGEVWR